ncbi:tetratricopeptide repeat protein [Streptomyces peucetius]|uniref:Tetratricopeptide repeat protein n=1 Tax=Streptomyces peucetius TaxID=1950 RepID=A0ABY6I7Z2_STRPE|nr:tetratricopeptide repeat protein [Streptomyces peucetius]UYQ62355.1 tetratricopeptide repeat protein [Streptomyces peucetius]
MKSETLKNAAVSTLVGATLVTGVIVLAPGWGKDAPPPAPGPVARAMAAADTGAPASLTDLDALIRNRERFVRSHPGDRRSWAALGSAYVERGTRFGDTADYPKAERALKRSLGAVPAAKGNVDALVGLAELANARHDFAGARGHAERARKQQPERWSVYPALIEAYHGLGKYAAAGKAMDKLLELQSGPQVQGMEARVYWNKGWREDAAALAYGATANSRTPAEKAVALHREGELAWERGEAADAVEHYTKALKAVPGGHRSLAGRARALAALGRTDEALEDYRSALAKVPLPEYALESGELYESLGLSGDAATQYELMRQQVTRAGEHGVNGDLVLARYEADHGDPAAAVRRLQGEWRRGHRSVYVADAMGWALYKAGRADDALPFARLATDQGLRSALFSYHLGEIERALGDYGPARRHLDEALRTNPHFSPLLAPLAREARDALGEPEAGGPTDMTGDGPSPLESPAPPQSPSASAPAAPSPSDSSSKAPAAPSEPSATSAPSSPSASSASSASSAGSVPDGAAASQAPAAARPAPELRPVQRSATADSAVATTG